MQDKYQYGEDRPGNPSVAYTEQTQLRDIEKQLPLRVLSDSDFLHWQPMVMSSSRMRCLPNRCGAPPISCGNSRDSDQHDAATWNREQLRDHAMKELNGSGMVEAYHNQTLWDNRQTQRVYDAFVDIWDRQDLWVTIDRANLNTPNHGKRKFGGFIHWDADTTLDPLPVNVQGVLACPTPRPRAAVSSAIRSCSTTCWRGARPCRRIVTRGNRTWRRCRIRWNSSP